MLILLGCMPSLSGASDAIHGLWREPELGALVRLGHCEDRARLCGVVVAIDDEADRFDHENPDPALRNRDLVGENLLWDFTPSGVNAWQGGGDNGARPGRIYLPLNGDTLGDAANTYEIVYDGEDSLVIRKRGCRICLLSSRWRRHPGERAQ